MNRAKTVDDYIANSGNWMEGLAFLRNILLQTKLKETIKWGGPVYTIDGKNVVGLGGFTHFISIWFFQGVFLSDPDGKLITAQEKTKGLRQLRYESIEDIKADEDLIWRYVEEAIRNQELGKEIVSERAKSVTVPALLKDALKRDADLNESFNSFTPGKQREFAEYIDSAKQESTKLNRLEKIIPMIKEGVGLNDKYKK